MYISSQGIPKFYFMGAKEILAGSWAIGVFFVFYLALFLATAALLRKRNN